MTVEQALQTRRAYRVLDPVQIDTDTIHELARAASLAASCYNKQPWRFVFVQGEELRRQMHEVFSKGNEWCHTASMYVVVLARKADDCTLHDEDSHSERAYWHFDTGMATAHLILRATELGLVAHPIAGYDPASVRELLNIPDDYQVLTIVNVGKHGQPNGDDEHDKHLKSETEQRPPRKEFRQFASIDGFSIEEKGK